MQTSVSLRNSRKNWQVVFTTMGVCFTHHYGNKSYKVQPSIPFTLLVLCLINSSCLLWRRTNPGERPQFWDVRKGWVGEHFLLKIPERARGTQSILPYAQGPALNRGSGYRHRSARGRFNCDSNQRIQESWPNSPSLHWPTRLLKVPLRQHMLQHTALRPHKLSVSKESIG